MKTYMSIEPCTWGVNIISENASTSNTLSTGITFCINNYSRVCICVKIIAITCTWSVVVITIMDCPTVLWLTNRLCQLLDILSFCNSLCQINLASDPKLLWQTFHNFRQVFGKIWLIQWNDIRCGDTIQKCNLMLKWANLPLEL